MQGEADYRKLSELPLSRAINHNILLALLFFNELAPSEVFHPGSYWFKEMISEELTAVAERDCVE